MRFFSISIFFGMVVGMVGYATDNWSAPLLHQHSSSQSTMTPVEFAKNNFPLPVRIGNSDQLLTRNADVLVIR